MKILITGGAGYIGSILTPTLLAAGHEVTVLDNFMFGQSSLLDCSYHPKLKIIRGDARNKEILKQALQGVDIILPLACLTGAPACDKDPHAAKSIIIDAVDTLLRLKKKNQAIIYPNTNSGYGIGKANIYCDEKSPLKPISLYGKLKVQAEKMILKSDNAIVLRLATVFGTSPRMRLDLLVNDFTYRAVYDGQVVVFEPHFKRNYIHVRDVARAFLHCIDNFKIMKNQVYNVGLSDANLTKWELCQEISKQLPKFYFAEAAIGKDPDQRNYIVNNAKLESTGFQPQFSLKDGIAELIKGYQIVKRTSYSNL